MRCMGIKYKLKCRSCYCSCKSEPCFLICDIQGQKDTVPFFCHSRCSSNLSVPASAFASPLSPLSPPPAPFPPVHWTPLSLFLEGRSTPSISPWVTSSAASHWELTHTPDITFVWHSSVFASVDLS